MQISKIARHSPEHEKLDMLTMPYFNNFGIIDYISRPKHNLDTTNMLLHEVMQPMFYKCISFNKWKYCVAILPTCTTKNNIKARKHYYLFFKIDIDDIPGILPETVKLMPVVDTDKFSDICELLCFRDGCRCSEILTCELQAIDTQAKKIKYKYPISTSLLLTYDKSSTIIPTPAKAGFLSYFNIESLSYVSDSGECETKCRVRNNTFEFEVLENDLNIDSVKFNIINDTYIISE